MSFHSRHPKDLQRFLALNEFSHVASCCTTVQTPGNRWETEWFLAGVNSVMHFQAFLPGKNLVTLGTFVGFLPGVNLHVNLHV
jgi:hypothetical protein